VERLKQIRYFQRHAAWLIERFPDAELRDVPGLCKQVSRADIEAADWSLTRAATLASLPRKWMRTSTSSRSCATFTPNWPT
jgi:type I restriction enzyme M protein